MHDESSTQKEENNCQQNNIRYFYYCCHFYILRLALLSFSLMILWDSGGGVLHHQTRLSSEPINPHDQREGKDGGRNLQNVQLHELLQYTSKKTLVSILKSSTKAALIKCYCSLKAILFNSRVLIYYCWMVLISTHIFHDL